MIDIWLETASITSSGSVEPQQRVAEWRVLAAASWQPLAGFARRRPGIRPLGGVPVGHALADDALSPADSSGPQ